MSATKLMVPEVEVAQATDPGKDPDKQVNEDAVRYAKTAFGHLVVVCDGMGGHEGGREASTLAVDTVFRYVAAAPIRPDIAPAARAREVLRDAIGVANHEVYALGAARPAAAARPGSTIVAALVHSLGTEVAHVGDSRCYMIHDGKIRQLTRDHSMVQGLVDAGRLTADEAAAHPEANKITRALGMSAGVEVELQRSTIVHVAGDTFVLCTDGLSDLVTAPEVCEILSKGQARDAAAALVRLANERGGHDNLTVAVVRTRENALTAAPTPSTPSRPRLGLTEDMPAVAMPSAPSQPQLLAPPSHAGPPSSVPGSSGVPVPDSHPLLPPGPPSRGARRRASSPVLAVALVLGLLTIVAVGVVVTLEDGPQATSDSPTPSLSIVLPAASLQRVAPAPSDDEADASLPDATPRVRRFHKKTRKE
jgi:protein phosphatase